VGNAAELVLAAGLYVKSRSVRRLCPTSWRSSMPRCGSAIGKQAVPVELSTVTKRLEKMR